MNLFGAEPVEDTAEIEEENQLSSYEQTSEYSWERLKKLIDENVNLSEEQKDFLYKLQFLFDRENQSMDMGLIYERWKDLKIELEPNNSPECSMHGKKTYATGQYNYETNTITLYNTNSWNEIDYSTLVHELIHSLQTLGYTYLQELLTEGKAREVIMEMHQRGYLSDDDLRRTDIMEKYHKDSDENNFFVSYGIGYYEDMWVYYALEKLVPEDNLNYSTYQETSYIKGLEDNLETDPQKKQGKKNKLFYSDIYNFSIDDTYTTKHNLYNDINYYYRQKYGTDMVFDADLYAKSFPYWEFNGVTFPFPETEDKNLLNLPREAIEKETMRRQYASYGTANSCYVFRPQLDVSIAVISNIDMIESYTIDDEFRKNYKEELQRRIKEYEDRVVEESETLSSEEEIQK